MLLVVRYDFFSYDNFENEFEDWVVMSARKTNLYNN